MSEKSILNVFVIICAGAVFATAAVAVNDWKSWIAPHSALPQDFVEPMKAS